MGDAKTKAKAAQSLWKESEAGKFLQYTGSVLDGAQIPEVTLQKSLELDQASKITLRTLGKSFIVARVKEVVGNDKSKLKNALILFRDGVACPHKGAASCKVSDRAQALKDQKILVADVADTDASSSSSSLESAAAIAPAVSDPKVEDTSASSSVSEKETAAPAVAVTTAAEPNASESSVESSVAPTEPSPNTDAKLPKISWSNISRVYVTDDAVLKALPETQYGRVEKFSYKEKPTYFYAWTSSIYGTGWAKCDKEDCKDQKSYVEKYQKIAAEKKAQEETSSVVVSDSDSDSPVKEEIAVSDEKIWEGFQLVAKVVEALRSEGIEAPRVSVTGKIVDAKYADEINKVAAGDFAIAEIDGAWRIIRSKKDGWNVCASHAKAKGGCGLDDKTAALAALKEKGKGKSVAPESAPVASAAPANVVSEEPAAKTVEPVAAAPIVTEPAVPAAKEAIVSTTLDDSKARSEAEIARLQEALKTANAATVKKVEEALAQAQKSAAETEKAQEKVKELDEKLAAAQQTINKGSATEKELIDARNKLAEAEKTKQELLTRVAAKEKLDADLKAQQAKVAELEQKISTASAGEKDRLTEALSRAEKEADASKAAQDKLEKMQKDYEAAQQTIADGSSTGKQLTEAQKKLEEAAQARDSLLKEVEDLKKAYQVLEESKAKAAEADSATRKELEVKNKDLEKALEELKRSQAQAAAAAKKVEEAKDKNADDISNSDVEQAKVGLEEAKEKVKDAQSNVQDKSAAVEQAASPSPAPAPAPAPTPAADTSSEIPVSKPVDVVTVPGPGLRPIPIPVQQKGVEPVEPVSASFPISAVPASAVAASRSRLSDDIATYVETLRAKGHECHLTELKCEAEKYAEKYLKQYRSAECAGTQVKNLVLTLAMLEVLFAAADREDEKKHYASKLEAGRKAAHAGGVGADVSESVGAYVAYVERKDCKEAVPKLFQEVDEEVHRHFAHFKTLKAGHRHADAVLELVHTLALFELAGAAATTAEQKAWFASKSSVYAYGLGKIRAFA